MGCKYNENYFENITANSAYILGFILADGAIYCPNYKNSNFKGKYYRIKICLNTNDIAILEFIKSEIAPDLKIYDTTNTRKGIIRRQTELHLTNKKLVQSVMNLGIYPNKTGKETLPIIPSEFYPDLIRGFFDGDGSVGIYKHQRTSTYLQIENKASLCSSSYSLLIDIKCLLNNIGGKVTNKKLRDNTCYFNIGSQSDISYLYNYMYYSDSIFSLTRKKQIFENIMEGYNELCNV